MFLLQVSIPEKGEESSVFIMLFVPQDSWFSISEHRLWGRFSATYQLIENELQLMG